MVWWLSQATVVVIVGNHRYRVREHITATCAYLFETRPTIYTVADYTVKGGIQDTTCQVWVLVYAKCCHIASSKRDLFHILGSTTSRAKIHGVGLLASAGCRGGTGELSTARPPPTFGPRPASPCHPPNTALAMLAPQVIFCVIRSQSSRHFAGDGYDFCW